MKRKKILCLLFAVGLGSFFSVVQSNYASISAQQANQNTTLTTDPAIKYAQNARQLLNQTLSEYNRGNFTGADDLATRAYLDNFEHVESPLEKKNAAGLKERIEDMMRKDLRNMIKDRLPFEEVFSHINATDAKLAEAISLLNSTK